RLRRLAVFAKLLRLALLCDGCTLIERPVGLMIAGAGTRINGTRSQHDLSRVDPARRPDTLLHADADDLRDQRTLELHPQATAGPGRGPEAKEQCRWIETEQAGGVADIRLVEYPALG